VKPVRISPDGRLLLYEVKQGGERSGTFELLDIETRATLPDFLPRGYLRGFAFVPDSQAFYYVHEAIELQGRQAHVAYKHQLGTSFTQDKEVFFAGEDKDLRLHIVPGTEHLGFLVVRSEENTVTDFYLWQFEGTRDPEQVIQSAQYKFGPLLLKDGRILAITDQEAPNFRIVEVHHRKGLEPVFLDIVPTRDVPIQNWAVSRDRIFVAYLRKLQTEIRIFDLTGKPLGDIPVDEWDTVRLLGSSEEGDELFFEQESFAKPAEIRSYLPAKSEVTLWAERKVPFESQCFRHIQVWFRAKDGTQI